MNKYIFVLFVLILSACASTHKSPTLTKTQQQQKIAKSIGALNKHLKKLKLAKQQRELAQYQANLCLSDEQYLAENISSSIAIKNNDLDTVDVKSKVVKTIPPKMPRNGNISNGYIYASYVINEQGCYTNIKIISGYPKGVYDQVLVTALRQWKNSPAILNKKAVRVKDQIQIDFADKKPTKEDEVMDKINREFNKNTSNSY